MKGIVPSKVMTLKSNYALFDYRLSGIEPKISNNLNVEARFIELFYQATEKLVNEKISLIMGKVFRLHTGANTLEGWDDANAPMELQQ